MADEFWTLNFHMKDAPSGEKFLEERMDKDLICYFDIIGIIEKQGYTSMDYLYCRRNGHGRRQSELVEVTSDLDVSRMVCEHEDDQKLSFYVTKQTDALNIRLRQSKQVHTRASADTERRQAVSDEGVNGSGYDTEASHETDCEAERVDQQAGLEAMKRRRADPNVNWKVHKKLRQQENLRFDLEDEDSEEMDEDNLQDSHEHADEEEDSQDMLEHDTTLLSASKEPAGSVKIIWPNGDIREFRGRFQASNLLKIKSGKVIVETDQNGIPNQRSSGVLSSFIGGLAKNSSYAPLHVARWDNKLLETPKQQLINYVETKFVYPEPTKHNTEAWILRIVNKRWRDYKSFLKNKYYNPTERSLERIKKQVPPGVNRHQWTALLGIWCQEQHLRTCHRNSESAKQQRHPHTTGRKSHARLRKEMEDENGGPVKLTYGMKPIRERMENTQTRMYSN